MPISYYVHQFILLLTRTFIYTYVCNVIKNYIDNKELLFIIKIELCIIK